MSTHVYSTERQRVHVRRRSHKVGHREREVWRPIDRQTTKAIIMAARKFELSQRQPGSRNGPLGFIAIEVLEFLANIVDFRTGKLEPSISRMMLCLRRSRAAIVRALAALKQHGFLDWIRRYEEAEAEGERGPQIKQARNAYALMLPKALRHLVQRWTAPPPRMPDCFNDDRKARAAEREAMDASLTLVERTRIKFDSDSGLGDSLAHFASLIQGRKN